jgi:hypothetical protein
MMADFDKVTLPWPEEGNAWDGLPMARLGLRVALYFADGYNPEVRRPLMAIIDQYVAFTGGRIRAYQRGGDRRRQVASPAKPIDLDKMRASVDVVGSPFGLEMSAEPDSAVSSHWSMVTVASDQGYLLMHFPLEAFDGAPVHSFRNLFQKWCSELNVTHAYAGLGLVLPVGGLALAAALRHCGPFLNRFVGLDADDPISVTIWCREGIRPRQLADGHQQELAREGGRGGDRLASGQWRNPGDAIHRRLDLRCGRIRPDRRRGARQLPAGVLDARPRGRAVAGRHSQRLVRCAAWPRRAAGFHLQVRLGDG